MNYHPLKAFEPHHIEAINWQLKQLEKEFNETGSQSLEPIVYLMLREFQAGNWIPYLNGYEINALEETLSQNEKQEFLHPDLAEMLEFFLEISDKNYEW
jgi:hypothetical protein